MVLTALALILMILAQSYNLFTEGFCGYLSNLSLISQSVSRNMDLRDASASKNLQNWLLQLEVKIRQPIFDINVLTLMSSLAFWSSQYVYLRFGRKGKRLCVKKTFKVLFFEMNCVAMSVLWC